MTIERLRPLRADIGVFGVGHEKYWSQFDGLLDKLKAKLDRFVTKVRSAGVNVTDFGMVDNAQSAARLLPRLKAADLDLVFVRHGHLRHVARHSPPSREVWTCRSCSSPCSRWPPWTMPNASTYMQLCNDDFCSVPEFTGVAIRMGRRAPARDPRHARRRSRGRRRDPADGATSPRSCTTSRGARIGHMGHVLEAMLDMHTDPTALTAAFGCHVVPDRARRPAASLQGRRRTSAESATSRSEILDFFDTPDPGRDPITRKLTDEDLWHRAARRRGARTIRGREGPRRPGLLLRGGSRESELRAARDQPDRRQLAAHRRRLPHVRRVRPQDLHRHADHGPPRHRRQLRRVPPDRLRQGFVLVGHDGPHHVNIADGKPAPAQPAQVPRQAGHPAPASSSRSRKARSRMLSIGAEPTGKFKFVIAEGRIGARPDPAHRQHEHPRASSSPTCGPS